MTWPVALFLSIATLLASGLVGAILGMLAVKLIGDGFDFARGRQRNANQVGARR